ncbi:TonB-dependent receptor domain-containing protein [Aquimarina hainanensis]|uniref:TonB-dependent receptor domain-containing protein n=1 Tax=Aquimarina hainanensis TaxID=1578017 RepID=A0ABW5NG32_9FLAO|nr:outer membrane beta-barrel family protein [Aquimarina sp. TRL1]QKX06347.1 TonB-dependent receptor [Aquimarina sp. TRL1]
MKKTTLVILFCLLSLFTFSQRKEVSISGTVIDKDSSIPLEYATISFYSPKQKKVITGGITDQQGRFSISIPVGLYDIRIEFISFETKRFNKRKLFSDVDLGTIALALNTESLDDVLVVAEKTTVDIKLDKKIYNVGKDLTVSGGTVSDVLDNVPSISVDVEGNVALRGNDNVRILINGKPSGLVGLNSTDALRQLPAESIERVEVITSPSARYDAEGTAGIVNVILKRSKLQGLNGAITTTTGYPFLAGVSGNINYRTGNFNLFTTSGYTYRESPGNSFLETHYFNSETPDTFLEEDRTFDRIRKGVNVNTGVEWYINDSSSLTASFLYRSSANDNNTTNITTQKDINGAPISSFTRFNPEKEDDKTRQYSLNYTKDFGESNHKLTVDFQIENSEETELSHITQDNISVIEMVDTQEQQDRILLQADYVIPLNEQQQIEIGYRGNFNDLATNNLVEKDSLGTIIKDEGLSNILHYGESVNAVYGQFGGKTQKLSYLMGLRMEGTRITIDQQTSNDFSRKNYIDFFPTVNLGYSISENETITLGYNRRIRRPRSRFINPFPSRSSATSLFQGNPDLDPSYSNAFDLGYINKIGKLTLQSSIYYNRATQVFTFIREDTGETIVIKENDTDPGVEVPITRLNPINLSRSDRYGAEFTITYSPNRKWRINGNFNAFANSIRGSHNEESFDEDTFSWFARVSNKLTLPYKINWQTTMMYRGPNENAQNEYKSMFSANTAFSKDIFKERASLTLSVNDIFNSRKRMSITTTDTFRTDSEFQWRERSFVLAFTYRFNQKKKRQRSRNTFDNEGGEGFGTP